MTTNILDPYNQMVFDEMVAAAKERESQIRSSAVLALAFPQTSATPLGMTTSNFAAAYRRQQQEANNTRAILSQHSEFITSLLVNHRLETFRKEQVSHLKIPHELHQQLLLRSSSNVAAAAPAAESTYPAASVHTPANVSRSTSPVSLNLQETGSTIAGDTTTTTTKPETTTTMFRKKDSKWLSSLDDLKAYKAEHGDCIVPRGYTEKPKLASWVAEQRKQYKLMKDGKPCSISKERVMLLEDLGFAWNAQEAAWLRRLTDLNRYTIEHGHGNVSLNDEQYPKLGLWVKEQRRHYSLMKQGKPTHMTEDRVAQLESIGFCWDTHEATWQERLRELAEFKDMFGTCIVPTSYEENPKLGTWVHHQRRQYKRAREGKSSHMTPERIQALESLGFVWYPRHICFSLSSANSITDMSSVGCESDLDTDNSSFQQPPRKKQRTD